MACQHTYCEPEPRWCLLSHMEGVPAEMPACTCGYDASEYDGRWWHDRDCALELVLADLVPEPPDGTRMEFVYTTDVYGMWRCDESSREAGWEVGDGGETWTLYGNSVPRRWTRMVFDFGPDALRHGVHLIPRPGEIARLKRAASPRSTVKRWFNAAFPYYRRCVHAGCWRGQTYQYRCHLHQGDV